MESTKAKVCSSDVKGTAKKMRRIHSEPERGGLKSPVLLAWEIERRDGKGRT